MKRIFYWLVVTAISLSACLYTPHTPTPTTAFTVTPFRPTAAVDAAAATFDAQVAASATALQSTALAPTSVPTKTPKPTNTSKPTDTPAPTETATATAIPEVPIQPLKLFRSINNDIIPLAVFGRKSPSIEVPPYYYFCCDNSVNPATVVERLPSYDGFQGSVIHSVVKGPSMQDSNQRAYVVVERAQEAQIAGPWAYEESVVVLRAPARLVHTGWQKDPIVMLSSIGMHLPDQKHVMVGGVRLLSEGGGQYYIGLYRVNSDQTNTVSPIKVPFKLGVKQGVREELFYNPDNGGKPTIRAFLIEFGSKGEKKYSYLGDLEMRSEVKTIYGDISWQGIYVGQYIGQETSSEVEAVEGEAKVFR